MTEKKKKTEAKRKISSRAGKLLSVHRKETESFPPIEVEGTVVKVVSGATEDAETQKNKRIAKRATRIARSNAFQRSLPVPVYRDGKMEEVFADTEEK